MKPRHIKHLQTQSRKLRVRQVNKNTFAVESVSNPLAQHIVNVHFDRDDAIHTVCTCPWAINRGVACSHVMATLEHLAATKGRTLSFWRTKREAHRQKHRLFYLIGPRYEEGIWLTSRAA